MSESTSQGLIHDTLSQEMDPAKRRLPLPSEDGRQIFQASGRSRSGPLRHEEWVLKVPELNVRRVVAWYYPASRLLVRRISGSHIYGNKPGVAWNLELLCRADWWNRRPLKIVCKTDEPRKDGGARKPYAVEWEVVRRFAHAALEGDDRWLITDDVDEQLLVPWPTWSGVWTAPPPPRDPEVDPIVTQGTLLDIETDPKPLSLKFPV